ncbi:hypothetical protein niasHT_028433 [Heterodera trifolii]|uniref:Uncharacterized protein n=1 Tax=Heterodera trifolii TaxID=157864 RepID=A0ABD2JKP9_9BILA
MVSDHWALLNQVPIFSNACNSVVPGRLLRLFAIVHSGNSSSSSSDEGTLSSASSSAANCALFECPAGANSECALTDATDAADQKGLLSVRLRRKDTQLPSTLSSISNNNNTSSAEQQDDEEDDG